MARYFVDYNHASAANTILWTHEKIKITETEPFIDYIRYDFDGEDYKYLHHDKKDFEDVKIINFEAVPGDEADTFLLCYVASMEIDLNKHSDFKKALDFSSKLVEVVIGFKYKGEILQYCFEEHENRQAELQEDS